MSRKLLLLILLLSGCAEHPYWTLEYAPVQVAHIVRVDYPCGQRWESCWNPAPRTIELRKGLTDSELACLTRHETAHALGWRHPLNMNYVIDCGPEKL